MIHYTPLGPLVFQHLAKKDEEKTKGYVLCSINPKKYNEKIHTGDTSNSLTTRQISDMDKGVIEGGENVGNAKDKLAFADLGTEGHVFRSLLGSSTLRLVEQQGLGMWMDRWFPWMDGWITYHDS